MQPPLLAPREARKADRRRAILEVAERSFLDRGFADTSMSTIATALGGSKTTLWSYFPSKEDLFAAVVDAKLAAFEEVLDEALIPGGGIAAALARFGKAFLLRLLVPASIALHRLIVSEAVRFPTLGETFATRGHGRVRARLATYLAGEMAANRLRAGPPETAARQFVALLQAGSFTDRLWWRARPSDAVIESDVAVAVDTFLRAWGGDAR